MRFRSRTYLAYALQHTDKPVQLVDFAGAMHVGQLRGLRQGDVMVAVSFAPYAEETMEVVRQASQAGVTVIAITDSRMGALAQLADVALVVQESAVFGFRALSQHHGPGAVPVHRPGLPPRTRIQAQRGRALTLFSPTPT